MADTTPLEAKDVGRLSLDDENKLYWDNKPIRTESIVLSTWQKAFAFVVAASAAVASLTSINQEFCIIEVGNSCASIVDDPPDDPPSDP